MRLVIIEIILNSSDGLSTIISKTTSQTLILPLFNRLPFLWTKSFFGWSYYRVQTKRIKYPSQYGVDCESRSNPMPYRIPIMCHRIFNLPFLIAIKSHPSLKAPFNLLSLKYVPRQTDKSRTLKSSTVASLMFCNSTLVHPPPSYPTLPYNYYLVTSRIL